MAAVRRLLNETRPADRPYGVFVVFDRDGETPQEQLEEAYLFWYETAAEMYAVWNMVVLCGYEMYNEPLVKMLDRCDSTDYWVTADDDEVWVDWKTREPVAV